MSEASIIRVEEIEQELFELGSDRNNVGSDSVVRFIDNRICELEEEKQELCNKTE